ncbi:MAG: cell filamentation protein Fic [Candidatus Pacebacteria bacterium CG_4_10_14_0_8_um_filter_42_14]|nr:MAG: cell filamentation protein Fic [Candidatus Pacebacteria bacterium CG_4_10_14_0_8_um_filter_42_14]
MKSKKQQKNIIARSSTAEYLTFISASGGSEQSIELRYEDENIWMAQKLIAELYGVSIPAINQHLTKLRKDGEINDSGIKQYLITASDGKEYQTKHYNLQIIISIGFKVENERAVQFRKWARQIIKEYTIKGFVLDDERLKNNGTILSKQFFDELLVRIREIRLSERKFYQKITDIYATSIDYDNTAEVTKRFFATVQNKLHWAIHGQTAAEVIIARANAKKQYMGLTSWKDAPRGKIQKFDVSVAKNYLTETELASLQRIVSAFLDLAEDMAERAIPMTMADWEIRLNRFIAMTDRKVLADVGKVTHELAKEFAESEFEKYRIIQDRLFENDFDRYLVFEKEVQRKFENDKPKK